MLGKCVKNFIISKKSKIDKLATRKSSVKITLMKAFGIIAVVCSHCPGVAVTFPMSNWVNPFFYFMPLFIFVSGYLYKDQNDSQNVFYFLKAKIKSLVVPYFVWNIFYALMNAFFKNTGVINYGDDISIYSFFVRPWIDGHQYHFNIPAWFMLSLFIDAVVTFLIRKLFKKVKIYNDFVVLLLTFVISLLSIIYAEAGYNSGWNLCFLRAGFMLPFFQLGFIVKKFGEFISKHRTVWICGLSLIIGGIIIFLQPVTAQAVFARFTGNPLTILALTSACLILVLLVCEILEPSFVNNKIVKAIGDNTFSIMMHHGFIIFLINFIIYCLSKIIEIHSFDLEQFQTTLWYCCVWKNQNITIVYIIFGIIIPIAMKWLFDKIIIKCNNRITAKNT